MALPTGTYAIFKTPEGTLLSTDLYLTNGVPELLPELPVNLQRMQFSVTT